MGSGVQNVAKSDSKYFIRSGNMELATDIALWTFKRSGVLRVVEVSHHLAGESTPPVAYTVEEDVVYKIKIEEFANGVWRPFIAKDVQLEFFRIDPFTRSYLTPSEDGVFNIKVDYDRIGYTHLFSSTQVSVRPKQHTQYERFISLHHKDDRRIKEE